MGDNLTPDEVRAAANHHPSTAEQWQRHYEHAQERYEAQFHLNAELIAGLEEAQAAAWDEGYADGVDDATMSQDFRAEFSRSARTNPYRRRRED